MIYSPRHAPVPIRHADRAWLGRRACDVVPRDRAELARWVRIVLGIEPVEHPLIEGSRSPLDYLEWAFFNTEGPSDAVVWASRGSGKTLYAAVATVLDLVFRAGIEVKILGGSREQAQRMHAHLRRMFERPGLAQLIDGRFGERRARLINGSSVEVLAQSERSVRGTRPQKLRCDEAELFDDDVWAAAQLVTRSKRCGRGPARRLIRGSVEAFSTCHRPGGLMSKLINESHAGHRTLFKWTAIDVLERCPSERDCNNCPLWDECAGRAKERPLNTLGHFSIDDAIVMKRRSGRAAWDAEMLCRRPLRTGAVFPEFDPAIHVVDGQDMKEGPEAWGPEDLTKPTIPKPSSPHLISGMDFGFRAPTAIVWATIDPAGVVRVIDEHIASGLLLEQHIKKLTKNLDDPHVSPQAPRPLSPLWIGVDPAGLQRSEQTGKSPIAILREAGLEVRYRRSSINEGLRAIRARLAPAVGPPTLYIHPRCEQLINCMMNYRYPDDDRSQSPLKDGHDHAVDALRYMIINLKPRPKTPITNY